MLPIRLLGSSATSHTMCNNPLSSAQQGLVFRLKQKKKEYFASKWTWAIESSYIVLLHLPYKAGKKRQPSGLEPI